MKKLKNIFNYLKNRFIKWYHSFKSLKLIQKLIYYNVIIIFIVAVALVQRISNLALLAFPIIYILLVIYSFINNLSWRKTFNSNIFIFGSKGTGKDMLMQAGVYFSKRKTDFISNMDYGYSCKVLDDLSLVMDIENTFSNLVENNIKVIDKKDIYEGKHLLISDASIYFPSHEDTLLKRTYPSFPLFYALSRQLYDMPVVVNTQVNGRLWKSLREQVQDGYVQAIKTSGFGFIWSSIPILRNYVFVKYRYYEKEESAIRGMLPFKKVALLNKGIDQVYLTAGGATKEMYQAENGKISEKFVIMKKSKIVYDTREFHKKIFGYTYVKED